MKTLFRFLLYTFVFVLPIVGLGGIGAFLTNRNMMSSAPDAVRRAVVPQPVPSHDPHKPKKLVRILDTLHLGELYVSNAALEEVKDKVEIISQPLNLFDQQGSLIPF